MCQMIHVKTKACENQRIMCKMNHRGKSHENKITIKKLILGGEGESHSRTKESYVK